jgi:hypothetical protein
MRWAGRVARIGEKRDEYRVLMGKPEGNRPLERPARRRENNIKMELSGRGCCDMDWIYLAWGRDQWSNLLNMVMNLRVPKNFGKFLSSCARGGFSRRSQLHGVN